jgi:hypothetical protein
MRSVLTEIYLCHACSCHEIEEWKRPGQHAEALPPRGGGASAWFFWADWQPKMKVTPSV